MHAPAQPCVAEQVQRLTELAARQRRAQRLSAPAGDNAFETYSQALALDPINKDARAGIALIADEYLQQAQRLREAGRSQESLAKVKAGLEVMPTHRALSALGQTLQTELAATAQVTAEQEARHQRIAELASRAERQWQAARHTEPPGDNAYQSYRDILMPDANNAQAQAGIERLAMHFVNTAQARLREGELAASLRATDEGLLVMPNHADLFKLRAQVQAQMAARQPTQEEAQSHIPPSPPPSSPPAESQTAPAPPSEEKRKTRVFGTF